MLKRILFLLMAIVVINLASVHAWEIQQNPILTPWAEQVNPNNVLPEYPRPQFERKVWQSLNGLWEYAIFDKEDKGDNPNLATRNSQLATNNEAFKADGEILVPFPIESALSGVKKIVTEKQQLVYNRTFTVPKDWTGKRILLNFEACDWQTQVFVNGKLVGKHTGGYAPFSFDITDALKADGNQELRVVVYDPTDSSWQPRGKQVHRPAGIWYSAVTGIWGSVWMEPVATEGNLVSAAGYAAVSKDGKLVPTLDGSFVIKGQVKAADGAVVEAKVVSPEGNVVFNACTKINDGKFAFTGKIENPKFWQPGKAYLYDVVYTLNVNDKAVDKINSYIGLRTSTIGKDKDDYLRLLVNGKFVFQYGPLDQGWWPDGLYTAPTDEALKFDIEVTQKMGFNMLRKTSKVEPRRFYYHCDKMGMLVWQDMPTGDKFVRSNSPDRIDAPDIIRCPESAQNYYHEWAEIMTTLQNSPSVVMWIPFNEGWGQFDTQKVVKFTEDFDHTRVVNSTSGWTFRDCGDVVDIHCYPDPYRPQNSNKYAIVLGEFGGLGLPIKGHLWKEQGNIGYAEFTDIEKLLKRYTNMMKRLRGFIDEGLSAAIYTQTTDVEIETNGLLTYDRKVNKMGMENVAKANSILYKTTPDFKRVIFNDSRTGEVEWKYTTQQPADGWQNESFDDSNWATGKAGFGRKDLHANPATEWKTSDIWLRKTFEFDGNIEGLLAATLFHDEDCDVYINGVKAFSLKGHSDVYKYVCNSFSFTYTIVKDKGCMAIYDIQKVSTEAQEALKKGKNVIAVHVKQTVGGQFIDLGLVEIADGE